MGYTKTQKTLFSLKVGIMMQFYANGTKILCNDASMDETEVQHSR